MWCLTCSDVLCDERSSAALTPAARRRMAVLQIALYVGYRICRDNCDVNSAMYASCAGPFGAAWAVTCMAYAAGAWSAKHESFDSLRWRVRRVLEDGGGYR